MKSKQLFFVIALCISAISQAQISTLYQGDSTLIKGMETDKFSYKVTNHDNDGYWSKIGNYYVNYDDNLNVINTYNISNEFYHKLNNKLYNIKAKTHSTPDYNIIIDSIYLSTCNLNGLIFTNYYLPNSIIGGDYHISFLKNRGLFAVASLPYNNFFTTTDDTNKFKLALIDTLGNVINSRVYDKYAIDVTIFEQGNNIMVGSNSLSGEQKLYYIDNQTLDIVDSMDYRLCNNNKVINDSILVSQGGTLDYVFHYYIFNTRSKTIDSIFYRGDSWDLCEKSIILFNRDDVLLDARNADTIVYAYNLIFPDSEIIIGIKIDNFSQSNGFNYRKIFNGFEPELGKAILGVTCTNDGGVILTICTFDTVGQEGYNNTINAYLLKYDPKGLLSVASVKPNEVAIIAYPNPTKDFINISSSSLIKEIQVYNTLGQEVYSSKANDKQKQINVSKFAKGNYLAKIQTDNGDVTKKFIVE